MGVCQQAGPIDPAVDLPQYNLFEWEKYFLSEGLIVITVGMGVRQQAGSDWTRYGAAPVQPV